MLKEIQTIGESAVTVGLSDSDRTAGLMFVDDLHLMAQSIDGLTKIIATIIKRCRKEGLIVNIKTTTLLLTKKQLEELKAEIAIRPILKHFDQKTKATHLVAITSPGKLPVYKHIKQRLTKAHSTLHEMTLRGFHVNKLGIRTVTTIIASTLLPILTCAMEAFPLTESDYRVIDLILDQTRKND